MSRQRSNNSPLNLGPASTRWLASVGIRTLRDVERVGSVGVYRILKEAGYPVSLNLVYALEGALLGVRWDQVPASVKASLRAALGRTKPRNRRAGPR